MTSKKSIYHILFLLMAFTSCSHDIEQIEDNETYKIISTTFLIDKIVYEYDENSSIEEQIRTEPPIIFNNNTSSVQNYAFIPANNYKEESSFWSSDTRTFEISNKNITIKTPCNISEFNTVYCDDGERWIFSKTTQKKNPIDDKSYIIEVEPSKKLTIYPSPIFKYINLKFYLHLIGNEQGEKVIVKGYWYGKKYIDCNIRTKIEPCI